VADVAPRSRKVIRKAQWRIILEKLSRLEGYFEFFHVSLAARISKNSKTHHAVVVMPSIVQHSITSSARAISVDGTSMPSAFAVLRLIASSYLGRVLIKSRLVTAT
jgi:N-formylglutamate amidohydrolase